MTIPFQPCPFCGSCNVWTVMGRGEALEVRCDSCGSTGPSSHVYSPSPDYCHETEAWRLWNCRQTRDEYETNGRIR